MKKKRLLKIIRTLGILVFALVSFYASELHVLFDIDFLGDVFKRLTVFESKFYDYRNEQNLSAQKTKSQDIFLIKIDDYSLKKLGVWPLPRSVYADLLKQLAKYNVKTVSFDVLFPEKSPAYAGENPDKLFQTAIEKFVQEKRVIVFSYSLVGLKNEGGAYSAPSGEEFFDAFPDELFFNSVNSGENKEGELLPTGISSETYPIREFIEPGANLGYISAEEDADGVFRKYKAVARTHFEDGSLIDSLALITYLEWSKEKNIFAQSYTSKLGTFKAGLSFEDGSFLELDRNGLAGIRYVGSDNAFSDFSLYNVLHPNEEMDKALRALEGKIVFIGSTANGAHDLRQTPVSPKMPGVYAHMNFVDMLQKRNFLKKSDDSIDISLILLIFGMVLFLFIHRFDSAVIDLSALIILMSVSYYVDVSYFLPHGYEIKLFTCYVCFGVTYLWNTFLNFYEANKEKKQIKGTFSRYVAPTVVEEMLKDPDNIQVGGRKMDITCLFSDVRDFTSISETLSAQDLANVLNDYMTQMTDIVFDTKGTLDKYIGDAIVAIWGAPLQIGNHAQHAVHAAIRMAEAMPGMNEDFKKRNLPHFDVGIGLNTGECSVGNMGSTRIFSYTALGDNMNLGARLEGLCKYYGTQILISEATLKSIDAQALTIRPIDKVIVKGRTQAVAIFEVISKVHFMGVDSEIHQLYMDGWAEFGLRNFQKASDIFHQLLEKYPADKPSKRLKSLCEVYLQNSSLVDDSFDVTKMTEK